MRIPILRRSAALSSNQCCCRVASRWDGVRLLRCGSLTCRPRPQGTSSPRWRRRTCSGCCTRRHRWIGAISSPPAPPNCVREAGLSCWWLGRPRTRFREHEAADANGATALRQFVSEGRLPEAAHARAFIQPWPALHYSRGHRPKGLLPGSC
jgi:hypothetical protein